MRSPRPSALLLAAAGLLCAATASPAQDAGSAPEPALHAQIDQTVVNVPTTLPLKKHKSYFRLTHRFARDLRRGSFGELAQDLFSLDNGAVIGLEYRYGITDRVQAGVHRSIFNKEIVTFTRWDALAQTGSRPLGISFGGFFEGANNLRQDYQPGVSATISHTYRDRLALYASPTYVHHAHTDTLLELHAGHQHDAAGGGDPDSTARDTGYVGLGARLRLGGSSYIVGEASPRLGGYTPDRAAWNVGVEKTTRGHVLQLNFGNNFDTTPGQIARGGDKHNVFMGFNISRKF